MEDDYEDALKISFPANSTSRSHSTVGSGTKDSFCRKANRDDHKKTIYSNGKQALAFDCAHRAGNAGAERWNFQHFLNESQNSELSTAKRRIQAGDILHCNESWRHVNRAILPLAVKEREICFENLHKKSEQFKEMASAFEINCFTIRHFPYILSISAFFLVCAASRIEIIHRELSQSRKLIAKRARTE